jgi:hypothetical protein
MKDITKKRMVFAFYLNTKTFENKYNQLHFRLLKRYINIFDEVIFGIIVDEDIDVELITKLQHTILSFYHKNITFHIYDNTEYREALVFYNEIVLKMDLLDDWTFFGHNKHTTKMNNDNELIEWICGLYYFNLEPLCFDDMCAINNVLPIDITGVCFYGNPLITNASFGLKAVKNKYEYFYAGSFFWGKYQEIHRVLRNYNISLPKLTNRYYVEMFAGEIMENDRFCFSFNGRYIIGNELNIDEVYRNIFYGDYEYIYYEFLNFVNEINNNESI